MNIHFDNKELYEQLLDATIAEIEFGSTIYGTNDENSDKDIMHIVACPDNLRDSFLWDSNQLQYKADNEDHIFTTVDKFMMNLFTGDSVVNFEMIHNEDIRNTELNFLYALRYSFYNYSTIRAYLGFARKDCKMFHKNNKKVGHAIRCLHSARSILAKDFKLRLDDSMINTVMTTKTVKYSKKDVDTILEDINNLRDIVNKKFDNGEVYRYASLEDMQRIDKCIYDLKHSNDYIKKSNYNIDLDYFYDAIENGIEY